MSIKIGLEMLPKILSARADNYVDLATAKAEYDTEESQYCLGFHHALNFVSGLMGIDFDNVLVDASGNTFYMEGFQIGAKVYVIDANEVSAGKIVEIYEVQHGSQPVMDFMSVPEPEYSWSVMRKSTETVWIILIQKEPA